MMSKLKRIRESRLISKSELARDAEVSTVTIDRIEKGYDCRMATKRRILEALGLTPEDRDQVFDD